VTSELATAASPRRREILRLVWDAERNAGDIAAAMPDVTFGAVSQHLGALAAGGFVEVRRMGRERIYRANRHALGPLGAMLETMWAEQLSRLKVLAELEAARRGPRPSTRPGRQGRAGRPRKVRS
jgi:DNA-binding transcriptional ArsR family regulator